MAQWSRMNQLFKYLPTQTVTELYPNSFPIEVRYYLASWIEEQRWEEFELDKADLEMQAHLLLEQIISILHTLAQQKVDVVEKMRLMHVSRNMDVFRTQPLQFGVMVRDILRTEQALLNNATANIPHYPQSPMSGQSSAPKMQDVDHLVLKVQELQNCRQKIHEQQEQLNLNVTTFESEFQGPNQPNGLDQQNKERQNLKRNIHQQELQLQTLAENRSQLLQEAVDSLDTCQSNLITRLKTWRWEQHRATIGHPFDDNLSRLQTWCETLLAVNGKLRQELVLVGQPMPEHEERLEHLLRSLIQSCLMADKQPPQVIKTHSRFSTTVRFLLGDKVAAGKPVVVKAQIITETQARNLGQPGTVPSENVGELINNTAILEHNQSNKHTCANFRNMSIRKIKRADRKGSESVTEEKFALLFSAEITITGWGTPYKIQTISLPLVIIVHGSQDHNALATILWDCAFSEPDRMPFVVPERVPWKAMCITLDTKFMSEVGTPRHLDEYNQHFLAQKIFDRPDISGDYSNMLVSWNQFNKEVLPGRPFTFWQWFEGVMELTKKHLKTYWSDGLIFGFIGKQHLHLILQDRPNGTFLLRFSDSEIGGITIAYVAASENGGQKIQNIQPFTKKDLEIRCLGDRIRDIDNITFLYPDFPKNEVFRKYYTDDTSPKPGNGYLPAPIRIRVADTASPTGQVISQDSHHHQYSMDAGAASPASNVMPQDSHHHHYPIDASSGAASPAGSMSQESHQHHYGMPGFPPINDNMVGGAESLPGYNDAPTMDIDDILDILQPSESRG